MLIRYITVLRVPGRQVERCVANFEKFRRLRRFWQHCTPQSARGRGSVGVWLWGGYRRVGNSAYVQPASIPSVNFSFSGFLVLGLEKKCAAGPSLFNTVRMRYVPRARLLPTAETKETTLRGGAPVCRHPVCRFWQHCRWAGRVVDEEYPAEVDVICMHRARIWRLAFEMVIGPRCPSRI